MLFQDWKTYFSVWSGRSCAIVDVVGAVCANIVFGCLCRWVGHGLFREFTYSFLAIGWLVDEFGCVVSVRQVGGIVFPVTYLLFSLISC